MAQAAQGLSVAFAALAQLLIIDLRPLAGPPAQVGPKMQRVAQVLAALAAHVHFVDVAGLIAHRSAAGVTLQKLLVGEPLAIRSDLAPEARRKLGTAAWQ